MIDDLLYKAMEYADKKSEKEVDLKALEKSLEIKEDISSFLSRYHKQFPHR